MQTVERIGSVAVGLLAAGLLAALAACSSQDASTDAPTSSDGGKSLDGGGSVDGTSGSVDGFADKPDGAVKGADSGIPHGPVQGLKKVGTAEYTTGLLMTDGRILIASGQKTPVLVTPNFPAGTSFTDFAGGLHQVLAADSTGHVWTWGDINHGLSGSGTDGGDPGIPYEILVDSNGNAFTGVASVVGGYVANGAVKIDGTVWVWGDCSKGLSGDGTGGGVITRPTQVPFPSGVHIKKLVLSVIALAYADDGTVWSWGGNGSYNIDKLLGRQATDGSSPGRVENLPSNVIDIASGGGFSYALTADGHLYGWGAGAKLGISADTPIFATDMKTLVSLPLPVKFVAANDHTTHVILSDGSLWAWGDDAEGEVGDGHEIDFGKVGPHSNGKYAWDWGQNELPVYQAVHIAPEVTNFKAVYTNTAFVFYVFAVTEDGHLYSWGRNKTGDLMNGIVPAAPLYGHISGTFPNSWDVTVPTNVNPFELQQNVQVTSPYCLTHPTEVPCTDFDNDAGKAVYE